MGNIFGSFTTGITQRNETQYIAPVGGNHATTAANVVSLTVPYRFVIAKVYGRLVQGANPISIDLRMNVNDSDVNGQSNAAVLSWTTAESGKKETGDFPDKDAGGNVNVYAAGSAIAFKRVIGNQAAQVPNPSFVYACITKEVVEV